MNPIRRAEPRDVDALLALLRQVNHVHACIRPDLFRDNTTKYSREELLLLLDKPESAIFVYDDQGTVLGYAFCLLQSTKGSQLMQDMKTLYVDDLCVDQRARNQHIGTRLYQYVLNYARSEGCYHVTLNVWEGNDAARAFYERMGMTVQKTGMEAIL